MLKSETCKKTNDLASLDKINSIVSIHSFNQLNV